MFFLVCTCMQYFRSSSQFLERKIRLFAGERTDCVSAFDSAHTGMTLFPSAIVSTVLSVISSNKSTARMLLGQESYRSIFGLVLHLIACSHGHGTEQNDCVSVHFSNRCSTLPLFETEQCFRSISFWTQPLGVSLFETELYGREWLRSCVNGAFLWWDRDFVKIKLLFPPSSSMASFTSCSI